MIDNLNDNQPIDDNKTIDEQFILINDIQKIKAENLILKNTLKGKDSEISFLKGRINKLKPGFQMIKINSDNMSIGIDSKLNNNGYLSSNNTNENLKEDISCSYANSKY